LNTLLNTPATDLFIVTPSGSLGLDIPIKASPQTSSGTYDFTAGGQPELMIVDTDLFSAPPTVTYQNFDTLLSFKNLSAAGLPLPLDQLSASLGHFATSPAFNTPIPFTKGKTLGSLVNVAFAYANKLSGLTAPSGAPEFGSIQDLQQMDQATDPEPITFDFIP